MKNLKKCMMLLLLISCMSTCTGCELYDWLVSYVQRAFASDHDYDVSVVDCKHLQKQNTFFKINSKLAHKLNEGIRQGVRDVSANVKYRNIQLTDSIPKEEFANFQKKFFAENMTYEDRTAMLRKYCNTYKTNIIICGATMGDDFEIVFIGWLYRRDLDVLTETDVRRLEKNTSERVQEKIVQDSIRELLENSLDLNPIGMGGRVASDMADNKEIILEATGAALIYLLQKYLESSAETY